MISVDRVYQTVQKILNKEQRGYFPPTEFNLLANQAQIEIFENYFYDLDIYMQGGENDSEYGNIISNLEEKIHIFETEISNWMENDNDIWVYPTNFYRLGTVMLNNIIIDEVSKKEAAYVNLSNLTAPTAKQPIYTKDQSGIKIYPTAMMDSDNVTAHYIRRPVEVEWAYMNVNGAAVYNPSGSQDFELHASELPMLILKICALAGVAIRSLDVAGFIQGEETGLMNEMKQ